MAHSYRVLSDPEELDRVLVPYMKRKGYDIPKRGCFVAAVAFNERGEVAGYQMLQNAIFAEGLDVNEPGVSLIALVRMVCEYAERELQAEQMLTLTNQDATGERIGKFAERMRFKPMPWNVYRRRLCH